MTKSAHREYLMEYSGSALPDFTDVLDWESESSGKDTTYFFSLNKTEIGTVSTFTEKHSITIYGVFLDEEYRGKGLGKAMMCEVMLDIIPLGLSIRLQVSELNKPALSLYTECGFKIIDQADITD